ncbi:reverse transcriptase domain-containing protein [Tanacetum coccineum]
MRTELKKEMDNTLTRQNNAFKNKLKNELTNDIKNMMSSFFQMNTASSSGSGSLPSNTVANPRVQIQAPIDKPVVAPKTKLSIPYASRANKQKLHEKDDKLASKFVEIFKELHFELSFADALLHMPKFASMFKGLFNNKEKLFDLAKTPVNENCSAVILKKLPEKHGDPDKFLIPCDFSELVECLALADLGASINLTPLSIWKKLLLPELTPTQMILELADRSTTSSSGIAKDVFVKVRKFHFLANFVVVDYVVDPWVPLILGRPFLRTTRALIDVYREELTLRVYDEAITFKKLLNDDPSSPLPQKELHVEELKTVKSSIDDPSELELKDLPSYLEYVFLKGTDKLPVIIAKNLKEDEKVRLIKVLKSHKRAIAWKISDIKGIDPQFCTHKILMEDDSKPAIQHQRRVNLKIHEVIKKEVIKLLDAGLIYPISDSPWVSPVHCVPKKGVSTNAHSSSIPHSPEIAALVDAVKAMLHETSFPPASVKAVEEICVTCGGPHPYHQCLVTDGNVFPEYRDNIQEYVSAAAVNYNQGNTRYRPQSVANQIRPSGCAQPNVQNNQTRYNQGYNQNRGNNQGNPNYQALIQQTQVAPSNELSNYKKINDANMKAMQNQINNVKNELRNEMQTLIQTSMSNQTNKLKNMMSSFFQINTASSLGSGSHPSNTVANPRGDLKVITTRSGISYDGPPIQPPLSPLPKVVKREPEVTKDTVQPSTENIQPLVVQIQAPIDEPVGMVECSALADLGASINLMPLFVWKKLYIPELTSTRMTLELADRSITQPKGVAEDVFVKVGKFHYPADFVVVDYDVDPRVPLILGRPFLRTARALIDVYGEEITLRFNDEAITFKVGQTSRYSYNNSKSVYRIDVIDVSCEEYAQEVLGFSNISKSSNPTSSLDPILSTSFPFPTPFEGGDFILEEIKACLTNDSILSGIDDSDFDLEGYVLLLEKLLNDDPSSPLPIRNFILKKLKCLLDKPSTEEPPELELKAKKESMKKAF